MNQVSKTDAAKLLQDHLIEVFERDMKDAIAEGNMREAVQEEAELKVIYLFETYEDAKEFYIETVRQWEPDRVDLVNELLSILVNEGDEPNETI